MPWRTVESFPKSQLLADSTIVRNSSLHPLSAPSQSLLSATCPFTCLVQTAVPAGLSASSSHSCNLDYTIFLELSSHPIMPLLKTLKRPPKFKVSLVMVTAEPPWALPSDCHPLPPAPTAPGPLFESAGPLPLCMATGRHRPYLSNRNSKCLIPLHRYNTQESVNTPESETSWRQRKHSDCKALVLCQKWLSLLRFTQTRLSPAHVYKISSEKAQNSQSSRTTIKMTREICQSCSCVWTSDQAPSAINSALTTGVTLTPFFTSSTTLFIGRANTTGAEILLSLLRTFCSMLQHIPVSSRGLVLS